MGKLLISQENTWNPEYSGVNYRNDYMRFIGEQCEYDDEPPEYLYYEDTDGYTFQITEESCYYYQNLHSEDMNGVAIIDPRDSNAWWWFKGIHKNFQDLIDHVEMHSSIISTIIPRPEVIRNYIAILEARADTDHVPDDWL